jgi:hypothetical protein
LYRLAAFVNAGVKIIARREQFGGRTNKRA